MSRSLETPSYSTHPSLTTSETSSIASSELPRTASENYNHSPIPWRAQYANTDKSKEPTERTFQPRFAKRFLRLVGTSHHQPSLSVPTNVLELNAYAARHAAELVEGSPPPSATLDLDRRKVQIPREEAATSWGRTSLASAASSTPLASKHSSLGPLPIFPRPPTHITTLSRQNSLSSTLAQARQPPPPEQNSPYPDHNDIPDRSVEDDTRFQTTSSTATWSQELPPRPTAPSPSSFASPPTSKPTPKLRPTLASLFQSASRKALKRDEFRKDSYRREEPAQHQPEPESFIPSSSVPSTPLRKRFLALKSLNAADFLTRSAKSSPAPPLPTVMTPSNPIVPLPAPSSGRKGKENSIPSTPILRRKRSSLPTPSPHPDNQHHYQHHHHHHHHHDHYGSQDHGYHVHDEAQHVEPLPAMNGRGDVTRPYQDSLEVPNGNAYVVRRSKSDSKHKRSHSPGLTTSIKVPGPPPQHHPHPHPFFPCDTPLDRGLLALPSFDFERPLTRPSTPGQSTEFLPMDKGRKPRLRGSDIDSSINAEIRSVLAAGTEARRERRAPSRERLRVIGPMHRQNIPDVTGGDDQLSPDPTMEPVMMSQPVNIPSSSRSKGHTSHMGHGLLPFESPAATPYGSKIDLPLTPPASKSRRGSLPQPPFTPNSTRTHHRQFSSTTTAVACPVPPVPPKDHRPSVEYPVDVIDEEVGILKDYKPPRLYTGFKPIKEKRSALPYTPVSTYDHHQPKPMIVVDHNPTIHYRKGSLDYNGREPIVTPSSSYRHHHFHSHSLSGSTVQGGINGAYPTPAQSPAGLGISLYSEQMRPPSRQDRFYDLREALKLSLADSRYRTFERALRRYHDHRIPLQGPDGLFDRVQRLLNEAVDDGLPPQTGLKYFQTFQSLLTE
ncbi:hypothetical protein CPB86DRAFT_877330 [Serendipita vermifera]|nr:hypothetical protein CPB86DRAFT_877330 [Serendipita vermifera]